MAKTLSAIFFGHGNPMNALASNGYAEAWRRIGQEVPRPKVKYPAPGDPALARRVRTLLSSLDVAPGNSWDS